MNEETLKEAWELFMKEREDLRYSSSLNPWEMFKAGFIAGTKQKLNIHGVMQAEGSASVSEAAVASEGRGEANTCADAGCPKCKSTNLFDVDDHWTKCDDCGFTFVG